MSCFSWCVHYGVMEEKMAQLIVRQKGALVQCTKNWPAFYMNDFSRLGLLVDNLSRTIQTLVASGYVVDEQEAEAWVHFSGGKGPLTQLLEVLTEEKISFESADLVSCAYQG